MRPAHILFALLGLALTLLAAHALGFRPWPAATPVALIDQDMTQTPVQECSGAPAPDAAASLSLSMATGDAAPAKTGGSAAPVKADDAQPAEKAKQIRALAGPLHGNVRSQVFHAPGCRYYDCKQCSAVFQTVDDALAAGYRPCRQCAQ